MWEVVICDSDKQFASQLEKQVHFFYQERKLETKVQIYTDGASIMNSGEKKADLILLNTRLSDMNGYKVAEFIRGQENRKNTSLIFLSDHDEDVFEAFVYQPFGYVRKRKVEEELEQNLNRLWQNNHARRSITVRHQRVQKLIRIQDITYVESQGHYISIHCVDGEVYRFRGRMAEYEQLLAGCFFVHSAKSYLVNCAFVKSVGEKVVLGDGTEVPCSKSRKSDVKKMHGMYLKNLTGQ